jgi:uncharacterized protein YqgV (UPF0045/DUF77 family)
MTGTLKKLVTIASMAISANAIVIAPTLAASMTPSSSDGFLKTYTVQGTQSVPGGDWKTILTSASSGNIKGNVELGDTNTLSNAQFQSLSPSSITGAIGGKNITLSGLSYDDWNKDVGGQTFGRKWFGEMVAANNLLSYFGNLSENEVYDVFAASGGFPTMSNPNIAYVHQNDSTGFVDIGLAGHMDAGWRLKGILTPAQAQLQNTFNQVNEQLAQVNTGLAQAQTALTQLTATLAIVPAAQKPAIQAQITQVQNQINQANTVIAQLNAAKTQIQSKLDPLSNFLANMPKIQMSEILKVTYDGNELPFLYSFAGTASGFVASDDGKSHDAIYKVGFQGETSKSVPEPSTAIALIGLGTLLAAKRKQSKGN